MWTADVLEGFEQFTLGLDADEEGDVVATLVRRVRPGDTDIGVDLLYVHGWNDYFFQAHLADFWEGLGVRFHALELRKYGRSIRDGQTPGYITDLETYDEEIGVALAEIGHDLDDSPPGRRLMLMGHSTGGLILSLWASRHPGRAQAVVLNAPWLELQTREAARRVLEPGVRAAAAISPRGPTPYYDRGLYARATSAEYDGEWTYDKTWRVDMGRRPTSAWAAAILKGHDQVARGLDIDAPVLVLLSARSVMPTRWSEEMLRADSVLDVVGVARRVPNLGPITTLVRIEGALHEVTLSAPDVREVVWRETERWFRGYVGGTAVPRELDDPDATDSVDTPRTGRRWWRRLVAATRWARPAGKATEHRLRA